MLNDVMSVDKQDENYTMNTKNKSNNSNTHNLNTRTMLASLTIRAWSARKNDKRITKEVEQRENASNAAGRYTKRLLPREALLYMQGIATEARKEHYQRTLPWSDEGPRILSSDGYLDYANVIRQLQSDFNKAADDFARQYPNFIKVSQANLGNMFNPNDYPHETQIREKFSIDAKILPMPVAEDFRVNLPDDVAADIRNTIESDLKATLNNAQNNIFERILTATQHMASKLKEYEPASDGNRAKGIFRDSLITNIKDIVALLPTLNITNDPRIKALSSELDKLTEHDADMLRENDSLRHHTAQDAQAIVDKVSEFLG